MDRNDQGKSKAASAFTSLPVRAKTSGNTATAHTQRDETAVTQEARLINSNNEHERVVPNKSQVHVPEKLTPNPVQNFQSGSGGGAEGDTVSKSSTRAVASGSPRRSPSIELKPDPEHPHAWDIRGQMQVLQKCFDGVGVMGKGTGKGKGKDKGRWRGSETLISMEL